ncbi:unnamed protein product [Lymnaea stagnalis]|uniref:EF-hand domain-containing protein n=1 Tax=Lymnaea stagnalis TaxID=6523 RepID=A0AAV2HLQ6_LYMST
MSMQIELGNDLPEFYLKREQPQGLPRGSKVRKKRDVARRSDFSVICDDVNLSVDKFINISLTYPNKEITCPKNGESQTVELRVLRQSETIESGLFGVNRFSGVLVPRADHGRRKSHPRSTKARRDGQRLLGQMATVYWNAPGTRVRSKSFHDGVTSSGRLHTGALGSRLTFWDSTRSHQSSHADHSALDNLDYEPNPNIPSYQPAQFMSSTILKKLPISKRHLDTFGGYDYGILSKRGVMLHTDRYQLDLFKSMDSMNQRDRLQAGAEYIDAIRGTRRRREMVPHRAKFDLMMGGKHIDFEERFDIAREIQKLKAIAMPQHAKDLYHGRGIHLPSHHMSVHPRHPMPNDIEDEVSASDPAPFHHLPHRVSDLVHNELPNMYRDLTNFGRGVASRGLPPLKKQPQLPSITPRSEHAGYHRQNAAFPDGSAGDARISMFQERRTVSNLSARLGFPARLHRDVLALTRAHTQLSPPDTRDQNTHSQPTKFVAKGKAEQLGTKTSSNRTDAKGHPKVTDKELASQDYKRSKEINEILEEVQPIVEDPSSGMDSVSLPNRQSESGEDKQVIEPDDGVRMDAPNPLKGSDLMGSVPPEEQEQLRQAFQRLDTDSDGHLKYNQLKTQLPKVFTEQQEKFTEEVYNLTNSGTFFGVDEFMIMNRLSKTVESLTGRASEAFAPLDFTTLQQELMKYLGQFQDFDTGGTGKISVDSLRNILSNTISSRLSADEILWDNVLESITLDYSAQVSKVVYIAHIPLFLSLEKDYME